MFNVALPENIEALLYQQMAEAGFETITEYLAHLILREQERLSQQAEVEARLIEGLDSGEPIEVTDEWWEAKRTTLGAPFSLE